ncbi:ABC-type cobalamin/Fe3+-siderophores transport system, ATPase component [Natrarchaeobaculum sulfurireducens]|uniref:Cobalamin import ATP-binding protein BtuD n=1 Tax=Natrarchaeobaculum sulfurireducens TaxID=2044521 RepID=A0A346PEZ2_9EURY|nr:heme ABC transporter ATP-binding protein [Natrarchaeobaculum sulfurireducens]AXR78087.1 ABC-type cobalamin/Fe3+-siderophores transport system, ATPase component [Natrarchaeobaculum sulfurireducens]
MSDDESHGSIDVRNVGISFGDIDVVSDVSFVVDPGELVGLVGPNGAGKTSLLRVLSGTLEPDTGTVAVDGTDLHELSSRNASRLVAVVPQDTSVSFSFDVRTVVEMGRYPHRSRFSPPSATDRELVDRALERTRTAQFADRAIDDVSGGERQRVVLARAVAQDTPIMLLDEPTASLDVNHAIETLELVRDLVDDGRTVVAAIHDLDLAARYCDRLVVVANESVVADGDPADVLTSETLASAFDVSAAVTPNPVTGTPVVTALPATLEESADGSPVDVPLPDRVHVFGTGTTAMTVLSRLTRTAIDCSVGPVPSDGPLAETARELGVEAIDTAPFSPPSAETRAALEQAVETADVTVLADVTIGPGNEVVLEAVRESGPLVVVERRPLAERNHAGDRARWHYEACRRRAVETDAVAVLEGVCAAMTGRPVSSVDARTESTADDD